MDIGDSCKNKQGMEGRGGGGPVVRSLNSATEQTVSTSQGYRRMTVSNDGDTVKYVQKGRTASDLGLNTSPSQYLKPRPVQTITKEGVTRVQNSPVSRPMQRSLIKPVEQKELQQFQIAEPTVEQFRQYQQQQFRQQYVQQQQQQLQQLPTPQLPQQKGMQEASLMQLNPGEPVQLRSGDIFKIIDQKLSEGKYAEVELAAREGLGYVEISERDRVLLFYHLSGSCNGQKKYNESEKAALEGLRLGVCREGIERALLYENLASAYFGQNLKPQGLISLLNILECLKSIEGEATGRKEIEEKVLLELRKSGTWEDILGELGEFTKMLASTTVSFPSKEDLWKAVKILVEIHEQGK